MSKTIDEKVVEMRFDNKQFESGISTTIASLGKLTRSLDLSGASKGLKQVEDTSKDLGADMTSLGSVVESVGSKFSAMKIIATTALVNITNSAVNAGKRLAMSLSVDQITAGWSKYEQKTANVQTLMNATGKSIDDINGYLDKLMWFSDETSYGFTDMTAALAQMTASGGDIDKLIPMITGVANATAYAGKGANEFSRVIYNLNQSYGAGYLQLMDWKSVELAGVGSLQLKQTLIDTAVQLGKIKEGQVTVANFAETLKDKWADTEVMEAAFGKFGEFSDAVREMVDSGEVDTAAEAIEKLSGKYGELGEKAFRSAQEAKSFSEAIDATKDAVSSGWLRTFEIIFGNYEEAKSMWTDFANTLWDIFASGADARNEMLQGWKDLGGRKALIEGIANAFHGVAAVIKPVGEAFREIFPPITAKQLYAATDKFRQLTENFRKFVTENEKGKKVLGAIKSIFKGLFAAIDIGVQLVGAIAKAFGKFIKSISSVLGGILGLCGGLGEAIASLRDFIKETKAFNNIFRTISNALSSVVNGVAGFVSSIVGGFRKANKSAGKDADELADKVENRYGPLIKIGKTIMKIFNGVASLFKKVGGFVLGIGAKIGEALGSVFSKLLEMVKGADFLTALNVINVGVAAGLGGSVVSFVKNLLGVSKTFREGLKDIIEGFGDILEGVKDAVNAFTGSIKIKMLKDIAVSIAILAAAVIALSLVNPEKLAVAFGAITGLFIDLFASMTLFQKLMGKDGFKAMRGLTKQMIGIAVATLILSFAIAKLAKLDWKGIGKGLVGITGAVTVLAAATKVLSSKEAKRGAKGMISLAISTLILSAALKQFSTLSLKEIGTGLLAMSGALGAIIGYMHAVPKNTASKALALVGVATALVILSGAMAIFGSIPLEKVGTGLLALGGSLGIVAGTLHLLPKGKAVALLGIATALTILAASMLIFGSLSLTKIGTGLLALGGALGIIAAAMHLLPNNTILLGAGLMAVSAAIAALVLPLTILGNLKLQTIGTGLLTIAGVLVVFGVAAYALKGHELTLLAVGSALALFGVACLAVSAAVVALSGALIALSASGSATVAMLIGVVNGVVALLPVIIENIGKGLVALLNVLADSGEAITRGLTTLLKSALDALKNNLTTMMDFVREVAGSAVDILVELTPRLMKWLSTLLGGLIDVLTDNIPKFVKTLGVLLDSLLAFLVASVPKLVSAGFQMIMGFLQGIQNSIPNIVAKGVDIIITLCNSILNEAHRLVAAGYQMIIDFCNGLADTIRNQTPELMKAFANLGTAMIDGVVNGLKNSISRAVDKVKDVGRSMLNGLKNVLGIHSPSKKFKELGEYSGEGLVLGLKGMTSDVGSAAKGVGKAAINTLSDAVSGIVDVVSGNMDMTPTIRPVIDLSDVESGEKQLSKMLGKTKTISVDSATIRAASVANGMKSNELNSEANPTNRNGGNSFVFTQNNYSPKSLSKTEIYRQTKNQIALAKEAIKAH